MVSERPEQLEQGKPVRPRSLRAREKLLDQAASTLDRNTDIGLRQTLRVLGRCWEYLRLFKGQIGLKFLFSVTSIVVPLVLLPWPMKVVVDHVILAKPFVQGGSGFPAFFHPFLLFLDGRSEVEIMTWIVILFAFLAVLFGGFGTGKGQNDAVLAAMGEGQDTATKSENIASNGTSKLGGLIGLLDFQVHTRLTQSLTHLLRSRLLRHIKSLPMTVLEDQPIGDTVYRVMYDSASIGTILYQLVISPVLTTTAIVTCLTMMIKNYGSAPEVVAVGCLVVPFYFLALMPFSRTIRRRSQASRAAGSATTGNIEEGMSNVVAVQSLGGNEREGERFDQASAESFKRYRAVVFVNLVMGLSGKLAGVGGAAVMFVLMSRRVIDGMFSTGDYFVVLYYYQWLSGAMGSIPTLWIRSQGAAAGLRRVFFLMDLPSERRGDGVELPRVEQGVVLEQAGLVYPDGRRALKNINLEARLGEIVALVGPTGAGKTSLAYLVPAFHQPTEGSVRIDGIDLADASVASLRKQVSYVFQEPQLFSDSILDNLRYAKPDATMEEVERVTKIAGAHDFVMEFPDGYDTKLGTVTSKVSVGQKQRLAIARGLLQDAQILILDEPTSALDPETEEILVSALQEAARDRLVIIVAHRLSTIASADKIVFLEQGEIREQGSHDELMARSDGRYREYVRLQAAS